MNLRRPRRSASVVVALSRAGGLVCFLYFAQAYNALAALPGAHPSPSPAPSISPSPLPAPTLTIGWPNEIVLWLAGAIVLAMIVVAAVLAVRRQGVVNLLVALMGALALFGLVFTPFAPNLGGGGWIVVDATAFGLFVVGAAVGFLYGLPTSDPDALKAATTAAGTFVQPGTKLDKVIDNLLPALSGGVITFAATQASHFVALFLQLAHLPASSPSQLIAIAILLTYAPLGFMVAYSLTATVGAPAFARAATNLVSQSGALVKSFPSLPDIPQVPTDEQKVAAKTIAAQPYRSLRDSTEKAMWGRAQAILLDWRDAERAFQDAIALDPGNGVLIVDYATTIYNDPTIDDIAGILRMLDRAEALAGGILAPPALLSRIYALRAAANLYAPGGYEKSIVLVNDWITKGVVPTTINTRFYRACALGQLYESLSPSAIPAAPPTVAIPNPADLSALVQLVQTDLNATIACGGGTARDAIRTVVDPNSPLRSASSAGTTSSDDDLQTLASDVPQIATTAGLSVPPTPANAPHPTLPVTLPNPLTQPGQFAVWIAANCPP